MRRLILISTIVLFVTTVQADETYPSVTPAGYLQVIGFYNDAGNDTDFGIDLNRIAVGFSGELSEKIAFNVELNATTQVVLDEAVMELKYFPDNVVVIGQFKVPFGLEDPYSSNQLLTINRAAFWELFDEFDTGLGLEGEHGPIGYQVAAFIRPTSNTNADHPEQDYVGRLELATAFDARIGVSGYYDRTNDTVNRVNLNIKRLGADFRFEREAVTIWAEYLRGKTETQDIDTAVTVEQKPLGYYVLGGYMFKPDWQAVLKYDYFDGDTDVGGDAYSRITGGFNWQVDQFLKLSANVEYIDQQSASDIETRYITQAQVVF